MAIRVHRKTVSGFLGLPGKVSEGASSLQTEKEIPLYRTEKGERAQVKEKGEP